MNAEIWCKEDLNLSGKIFYREAVRAIILKGDKLLMVHSDVNGDYKFPGGGVEEGENYIEALKREVLEEAGAHVLKVEEFGELMEYDEGQYQDTDVFKMLSKYYFVSIKENLGELNLDYYEEKLKFHPVWVTAEEAYNINKTILNKNSPPRWTKRETYVLNHLLNLKKSSL